MKAIVYKTYGAPEVLQLAEVEKPAPKDDELLIKIDAVAINYGDVLARNFGNTPPSKFNMPFLFYFPARIAFGFRQPKIQTLGSEFAGQIEAVGKGVTRFKVGEAVFGYRGMAMGANAEYLCMPENGFVALKPTNMGYEEAATVPYGALTALNLLRKAAIQPGQKVLINGASGGIGCMAVQIAKSLGAEVTGVCGTPRLAFVRSLGADKVIDYTQTDFTEGGERYDLIFDILGKSSLARCRKVLTPNGRYLLASFKMKQLWQMAWTSMMGGPKVICALSNEKPADLLTIKEWVEAGKIKTIIDRCFPLAQTAAAHRYMEAGEKKGHVVITVSEHPQSQAA